jgi:hypothetical protein
MPATCKQKGAAMSTPPKKLKQQPTSRTRDATATSGPARLPQAGRSDRRKTKTPAPRTGDNLPATSPVHRNEADDCAQIMETLGTTDPDFAKGIYAQLVSASFRVNGSFDAVSLFFSLAVLKGKKPKNQFEAMLLVQAVVTHVLTMKWATQVARADELATLDSAQRAYNKLATTFLMQLEALTRSGGEHNVTVQNVSVSDGGRAIVGNVTHGAR